MQQAYDILEYHSYIQQVQGGKSGNKGLIWISENDLLVGMKMKRSMFIVVSLISIRKLRI